METLTIGKLAKEAKVNVETVRFYERRHLIPQTPRRESGYRQYSQDIARRIRFIKHAQGLGFSLNEISDLLSLRVDPNTTCEAVRRRTEAKVANIEDKISALQQMKDALAKLTEACNGIGPIGDCPILSALDTEEF